MSFLPIRSASYTEHATPGIWGTVLNWRRTIRDSTTFTISPTISRPDVDPAWDGEHGRVQKWLKAEDFEARFDFKPIPEECHVFLCGNPGMTEDAMTLLIERGFVESTRKEPGTLHVEKYW